MFTNVVPHMFSHSIQLNSFPACLPILVSLSFFPPPPSVRFLIDVARNTIARKAYRISKQIERNLKLMRHLFGCRALRQNFHFRNCCFSFPHSLDSSFFYAYGTEWLWRRKASSVLRKKLLCILLIIHNDAIRLGFCVHRQVNNAEKHASLSRQQQHQHRRGKSDAGRGEKSR